MRERKEHVAAGVLLPEAAHVDSEWSEEEMEHIAATLRAREQVTPDPVSPPQQFSRFDARFLFFALSLAVFLLLQTSLAVADDAAEARKKLDDEYIPFTPEKYLHYVFMDDVETVRLFLDGGMAIGSVDAQGRNALHIAAGTEDGGLLALLLDRGADVNLGDTNGTTPLCVAAEDGIVDNVKMFLQANADLAARCSSDRNTPLHSAASRGHGSIVKALIEAGADLEAKNRHANTPLHTAVSSDNKEVLQILLAAGADVAARNNAGETPLHLAVSRQEAGMVKVLLAAGAPLEARNARGATPLWLAANFDAAEMAQMLIAAGADPEAEASDGDTPMQIAEKARSARVIAILRDAPRKKVPPQSTSPLPKTP